MRTILFVCTGNTCRSPMAEGIARAWADTAEEDVFIASAGVATIDGMPTSPETVAVLDRLGTKCDGRSTVLTADMIKSAQAVLCMTGSHMAAARALVADDPDSKAKVMLLDPTGDIPDPIGSPQSVYDSLAEALQRLIADRLPAVIDSDD